MVAAQKAVRRLHAADAREALESALKPHADWSVLMRINAIRAALGKAEDVVGADAVASICGAADTGAGAPAQDAGSSAGAQERSSSGGGAAKGKGGKAGKAGGRSSSGDGSGKGDADGAAGSSKAAGKGSTAQQQDGSGSKGLDSGLTSITISVTGALGWPLLACLGCIPPGLQI